MKPFGIAALLIAATLSAACSSPPPKVAPADAAPVTVTLTRAEVRSLTAPFEAGGIVLPRTTAIIASRIMAPVAQVRVRPGDRVNQGAALVTLDPRQMESNRAQALAASAAATEAARAAESDIGGTEAALVLARASHERISGLRAKNSATPLELDQAVAALAAADAQRRSALARAAAAHAARDAASAAAAGAEIAASYTVISAPFTGIVTARTVDPGSMAMPGAPLITLEDPSTFHLEVQVDDQRAILVKPGQDVEVRIDEGQMQSSAWLHGRVVEIARIDSVSHSFAVKVELPTGAASRSGLYGRVRFAGPARDTLTVPATAVVHRGQLTFVFKVGADGAAHLRPVTIGQTDHERAEVLAGVQSGDSVVSHPPLALSDGVRVTRSAS